VVWLNCSAKFSKYLGSRRLTLPA